MAITTTDPDLQSQPLPDDGDGDDEPRQGRVARGIATIRRKLKESSIETKEIAAWVTENRVTRDIDRDGRYWIDDGHYVDVDVKDPIARVNATGKIREYRQTIMVESATPVTDDDPQRAQDEIMMRRRTDTTNAGQGEATPRTRRRRRDPFTFHSPKLDRDPFPWRSEPKGEGRQRRKRGDAFSFKTGSTDITRFIGGRSRRPEPVDLNPFDDDDEVVGYNDYLDYPDVTEPIPDEEPPRSRRRQEKRWTAGENAARATRSLLGF